MLVSRFRVFYSKLYVLFSQGMVAFPKGYHQSLVGEDIDEPWNSFGSMKNKIYRFLSK